MSTVFVGLVLRYDFDLRRDIHAKMIQRDAAVLTSVAQQEIETSPFEPTRSNAGRWLAALLPSAHREGLLAMTIFDSDGIALEKIPTSQTQVELPPDDFVRLQDNRPITRYWPEFSLSSILLTGPAAPTPVLEIVLSLHGRGRGAKADGAEAPIGFVHYHLDARALATELAALDAGVRRQTAVMLTAGLAALALLVGAAYAMLGRAHRTIAERTAKLQRANFELTLAAKTSALGQITSHLVHGLQGPVAGLRSMVATDEGVSARDWKTAANYADQMQVIIEETVALLGDHTTATAYELTGPELADAIRRRNVAVAESKGVTLQVDERFPAKIDSHRGGLLCLIASNLVQNAIEASAVGGCIRVSLRCDSAGLSLLVSDDGPGIPAQIRDHIFEPGFSGRVSGTGLGLAISQLLARQIGAALVLDSTGPDGTTFRVTLPV
ncbi:MAG: sensor histidine kinase [Opitutus sp.]